MRRNIIKNSIIVFLLAIFLPVQASAEEGEGLWVSSDGTVTLVSDYAVQEEISTISFSLTVNATEADNVIFHFYESNARIQDFRYDKESRKLNIYMAGTEPLMEHDGQVLSIGRIEILDGNGGGISGAVGVAAGTLMYVDGTELKWMSELEPAGEVQVNGPGSGAETPSPTPQPSPAPEPTPTAQPSPTPEPTPTAQPTAAPQPASTPEPSPAATPQPTPASGAAQVSASPAPTQAPQTAGTPEPVTPPPAEGTPTPEASPEPETEESAGGSDSGDIALPVTGEPEDSSGDETEEMTQGFDWVFVAAVIAIILFVIVAVTAVVVLKKKPRADGLDDDF